MDNRNDSICVDGGCGDFGRTGGERAMKTSREVIWGLIYDLLPESWDEEMVLYIGIDKWETEVKDIVDSVEELAQKLEDHMKEKGSFANKGE